MVGRQRDQPFCISANSQSEISLLISNRMFRIIND